MSEAKQVKSLPFVIKGLTHCLTAFLLLCVYFSSLQISRAEILRGSDEVFCPLQKTWVKKDPARIPTEKQKEPLKDICAREERKGVFLFELGESLRFTRARPNNLETEKLFFTYFAEGRPALAHYISSQNIPPSEYVSSAGTEKRANSSKFEFANRASEIVLPASQHPLLTGAAADNFASQVIPELKNISRHISPRAPPVPV